MKEDVLGNNKVRQPFSFLTCVLRFGAKCENLLVAMETKRHIFPKMSKYRLQFKKAASLY